MYPPILLFFCLWVHGHHEWRLQELFPSGSAELCCVTPCLGCARKCAFSVLQHNDHLGRVEPKPQRPARTGGFLSLLLLLLPESSKLYNPDVLRVSEQLAAAVVFMVKSKGIAVVYNLRVSSLAKNAGCSLLSTYLTQMLRVSPPVDSRFLQRLVCSHPSIRIKNELSFSCICFGKREII